MGQKGLRKAGVVLASLTAVAVLGSACTPRTNQPSDAAIGKQVYQANCARCHGEGAIGGMRVAGARSGNLRARTLEGTYFNDARLITRSILDGQDEEGRALDDAMPRWRGKISETQVTALIAYLRSLR